MSYFIDDNDQYKRVVGDVKDNIAEAYASIESLDERVFEASSIVLTLTRLGANSEQACDLLEKEIGVLLAYAIERRKDIERIKDVVRFSINEPCTR